jgi:hypothetical protein
VRKIENQTLEREKSVFVLKKFFLWRTGSRTHRYEKSENKNFVDPNPKKMSSDPQH